MARNLAKRRGREREQEFAAQFEAPELLTLGIVYERSPRFAGGAYSAFLKKVDRFSERTLAASLKQREDYAARILEIDARVKSIITALQARGFKSPYLRNYVVARINPVRFHKAKKGDTQPPMPAAAGAAAHVGRRAQVQRRLGVELRSRLGGRGRSGRVGARPRAAIAPSGVRRRPRGAGAGSRHPRS